MVVTRYETLHDQRKQDYLLSQCGEIQGLVGLVVEILKVEASLQSRFQ